ncbi:MAG: hypothetical protein QY331_03665 [Melioribacteraceae bacterium]|nr:hypothetical protein [Melioribacteraceae bacterium]WKZ70353.1 MAG: hypothetical protein QY331_03665 [Melioribacteraceae bacterium]
MNSDALLILGGIFNLVFAVFHLSFWRIFNWQQDLKPLRYVNRALMQILNLCLTFVFFIFAYISFSYTYDLLITRLGHSIIASISVFWFLRAFMQVAFFGLKNKTSILFFVLFLIGGVLYIYPLV